MRFTIAQTKKIHSGKGRKFTKTRKKKKKEERKKEKRKKEAQPWTVHVSVY